MKLYGIIIIMKNEIADCKMKDCKSLLYCKGFCRPHYERSLTGKDMDKPIRQRYNHGLSKVHPLYSSWQSMRQRCNNPNHPRYKDWGGRGIKVCDRWNNFANFISDIGKRPQGLTLERIDNQLGYSPENCKWATPSEQLFNSRLRVDNTSGHKGIYWSKANKKWQVKISHKHIGYFSTQEEAVKARKLWRSEDE